MVPVENHHSRATSTRCHHKLPFPMGTCLGISPSDAPSCGGERTKQHQTLTFLSGAQFPAPAPLLQLGGFPRWRQTPLPLDIRKGLFSVSAWGHSCSDTDSHPRVFKVPFLFVVCSVT